MHTNRATLYSLSSTSLQAHDINKRHCLKSSKCRIQSDFNNTKMECLRSSFLLGNMSDCHCFIISAWRSQKFILQLSLTHHFFCLRFSTEEVWVGLSLFSGCWIWWSLLFMLPTKLKTQILFNFEKYCQKNRNHCSMHSQACYVGNKLLISKHKRFHYLGVDWIITLRHSNSSLMKSMQNIKKMERIKSVISVHWYFQNPLINS